MHQPKERAMHSDKRTGPGTLQVDGLPDTLPAAEATNSPLTACEKRFGRKVFWGSALGAAIGKAITWIMDEAMKGHLF